MKTKISDNIEKNESDLSIRNLHQYLNLRKHDFSSLQDDLTKVGLSSFGRSQAHIEASINVALEMLSSALHKEYSPDPAPLSYEHSHAIMDKNAELFSVSTDKTKIMITVPTEHTFDPSWFNALASEGVHLFRINTAHDNIAAWKQMAEHIRNTRNAIKDTKIYVDLAGPKIRTVVPKNKKGKPKKIKLFENEKILIRSGNTQSEFPKKSDYAAVIGCTLENIEAHVKPGESLYIDDGKIEMAIESVIDAGIVCRVITRKDEGSSLKDEKGINFPNSDINIEALSQKDLEILPAICEYADIIGVSFTQNPEDILRLIDELDKLGKKGSIGIVAKIETKKGVENLPLILETLIGYGLSGVMIARGDLAIEIGFENLAYMQEEILDLCTAAHMPVILATQVLENKMKTNLPSRAEISDAVFAHNAECVMLNKGEYALETVGILKSIFTQMDKVFRKHKLLYNPSFQWK